MSTERDQRGRRHGRRPASDEAREQLVREQAAARRQDDAVVGRDVDQLRAERPAERVGERRLLRGRERARRCRAAGRGSPAPRRRSPASTDSVPPGGSVGADPSAGARAAR